VKKGVRLFLLALAATIGFSMAGCLDSENGAASIYGINYPASYAQAADADSLGIIIIRISGIPARYDNWNGTISLWNDLGEGLGGSMGTVTGDTVTFTFIGNSGVYDGILSFWDGYNDRHLRIWSRRITAAANTISFEEFGEFSEFTY